MISGNRRMGITKTVLNTNKILLTISALGVIIPASTSMGSDYDY